MYIGMFGGYLFILLQFILLIDFAHNWSESWYVTRAWRIENEQKYYQCPQSYY